MSRQSAFSISFFIHICDPLLISGKEGDER